MVTSFVFGCAFRNAVAKASCVAAVARVEREVGLVEATAVVGTGCRREPCGRLARARCIRRRHPERLSDVGREADEVVRVAILEPGLSDVAERHAVTERQVRMARIRLRRNTTGQKRNRGRQRSQDRNQHLLVPTPNSHPYPLAAEESPLRLAHNPANRISDVPATRRPRGGARTVLGISLSAGRGAVPCRTRRARRDTTWPRARRRCRRARGRRPKQGRSRPSTSRSSPAGRSSPDARQ